MELTTFEIAFTVIFFISFILIAAIFFTYLDWVSEKRRARNRTPYITQSEAPQLFDTPTYKRRGTKLSFTYTGKKKKLSIG